MDRGPKLGEVVPVLSPAKGRYGRYPLCWTLCTKLYVL